MKTKEKLFFNLFIIFFVSLIILGISRFSFFSFAQGVLDQLITPFGKIAHAVFRFSPPFSNSEVLKLEQEKRQLIEKIADEQKLQKDLAALKDQFQVTTPASTLLLPSNVVGAVGFIPNITPPEMLIFDKGSKDGVVKGQAVVVGKNLIGKIIEVSAHLAKVSLITSASFSTPGQSSNGKTIGVIKGKGNGEIVFDNVLLSDSLSLGDIIVTKGTIDMQSVGVPKDLVVGTITSIDKKPSALFQTAKIKTTLDMSRQDSVFVVIQAVSN